MIIQEPTKPKILLGYGWAEATTATHLHSALQEATDVTPVGTGHPGMKIDEDVPMLWVESFGPQRWLPCGQLVLSRLSAAWMIDTHLSLAWRLRLGKTFDHIFVAQKPAVEAFAATGASVSWLPLAAPSNLLAPGKDLEGRLYDVAFVGRVEQGSHREAVLRAIGGRFSIAPRKEFLAPAEMMDLYRSARTVVTMPIRGDLNMRVFEAAAARSIVVTTRVEGLEDVLPEGSYVLVTHDDPTAWVDGVAAALASPDRQHRADSAYSAVREGHTYEHRARAVLERLANLSHSPMPPGQRMRALAYAQARYGKPILAAAVPTLSILTRIRMFVLGICWATLRAGMDLTAQCAPSLVQRIDPCTSAWTKKLTGISTSVKRRIGTARGHESPSTPEGGPNAHTGL